MAAESTRLLGENIRIAREALGLTQLQLALAMEGQVSADRVSKWERGENRPRDETLDDLARVLETTAGALLCKDLSKPETSDPDGQPDIQSELAIVLAKINARLDDQDEILKEIKTEQTNLRGLIEGTAELRRLAAQIVKGQSPEGEPNSPLAPEQSEDA